MSRLICDRQTGDPISLHAALIAGKKVGPDVTGLLTEDHRIVLGWFAWHAACTDPILKEEIVAKICDALDAHMAAEEEIVYPAAQEALGDDGLVERAYEEHRGAQGLMRQLRQGNGSAAGERDQTVRMLEAEIRQHVQEEETELFPALRQSTLNLYELGEATAARRVDRLFELRARAGDANHLKEYPAMPISQDEAREYFTLGLKNAHATASQCRTMVKAQVERVEQYPKILAKLQSHLQEKDAQLQRLETIMDSYGVSRSALKEAAMTMTGTISSMATAAAGDEIIKNSFSNLALAKFESAAYETLILFAQAAGATDALRPLQQSLSEERAMASFIEDNLRPTGMMFLQLKSEGVQASH